MEQYLFKSAPMGQIVDADEKSGIVKGYASVFDNKDSDGDVIKAGAYKKTIAENGHRVKYLYQHDMDKPIGKMRLLEEDNRGLVFEAEIAKTQLGNDVIELIKSGVITENSVGILPIQKEMKSDYREITEVKLFEVSAVTLAANDQAMILDVKGNIDREKVLKRFDRLSNVLRNGKISDEAGFALESEILKLKSLFDSFTTKPTEIEVTSPEVIEPDSDSLFKYLYNRIDKK